MEGGYRKMLLALGINFVLMFLITYTNLDRLAHFHANLNRVYMSLMMVAPMGIVMLLVMRAMFQDRTRNLVLGATFAGLFLAAFALTRTQAPIGDGQFLRSMIPHHSSAIVMCQESSISDAQIRDLCGRIVKTQKEEIAEMEGILRRY